MPAIDIADKALTLGVDSLGGSDCTTVAAETTRKKRSSGK